MTATESVSLQLKASIVAFRNDPGQLLAAIESVLRSTLRLSLVVLDNSPTDDLRECVESTGAQYCFNGRNLGFGKAHNLAIHSPEAAEYHLVLNPDVYFGSGVLEVLYEFMRNNPDVGLVMPRVLYPDSTEQRLCKLIPTPINLLMRRFVPELITGRAITSLRQYQMEGLDFSKPRFVPVLSGCFMFLNMSILNKIGGFDERYFMYLEDVDLCRRIAAVSDTVFFPNAAIYHEYGKGSYLSARLLVHHLRSAWQYFSKWGWIVDREREQLNSAACERTREYRLGDLVSTPPPRSGLMIPHNNQRFYRLR
jgi:GT2 family glycosyltransferase